LRNPERFRRLLLLPMLVALLLLYLSARALSAASNGAAPESIHSTVTPDPFETVESTPSPSPTATTTASPTVTVTPSPASTATPSGTPTPTPTAYFAYLQGLQLMPPPAPGCTPLPHIPAYSLIEEQNITRLLNEFRVANGRPALNIMSHLVHASRRHALDMADNGLNSHLGSDGSTVGDRVTDACYVWNGVGEILGHLTGAQVMAEGWFNSPGNRALILSDEYIDFGAAYYYDPGSRFGHYWVVTFARPLSAGHPPAEVPLALE
jgi:uncharacterized protein YkwD